MPPRAKKTKPVFVPSSEESSSDSDEIVVDVITQENARRRITNPPVPKKGSAKKPVRSKPVEVELSADAGSAESSSEASLSDSESTLPPSPPTKKKKVSTKPTPSAKKLATASAKPNTNTNGDIIIAKKRGPGRPRTTPPPEAIAVRGITNTPISASNAVEMICDKVYVIKQTFATAASYKPNKTFMRFGPNSVRVECEDVNANKIAFLATFGCTNMNSYFFDRKYFRDLKKRELVISLNIDDINNALKHVKHQACSYIKFSFQKAKLKEEKEMKSMHIIINRGSSNMHYEIPVFEEHDIGIDDDFEIGQIKFTLACDLLKADLSAMQLAVPLKSQLSIQYAPRTRVIIFKPICPQTQNIRNEIMYDDPDSIDLVAEDEDGNKLEKPMSVDTTFSFITNVVPRCISKKITFYIDDGALSLVSTVMREVDRHDPHPRCLPDDHDHTLVKICVGYNTHDLSNAKNEDDESGEGDNGGSDAEDSDSDSEDGKDADSDEEESGDDDDDTDDDDDEDES